MKPPAVALISLAALLLGVAGGVLFDSSKTKQAYEEMIKAEKLESSTEANLIQTRSELSEARSSAIQDTAIAAEANRKLSELQSQLDARQDAAQDQAPSVQFTPGITFTTESNAPIDPDAIQHWCRASASPEWCAKALQAIAARLAQSDKPSDKIALKLLQAYIH